ncbi:MAG: hypothetical protein DHS20C15_25090 [Planctomycetota bacterium]|nr:MAG: hypothetical protein DHS20C15_25090 [Planctomycetota bacterium]
MDLHESGLLARFRAQGLDEAAARDCAQETFLRLHRAAPGYEPRAPFGAFLALLARNALADWRRRRGRREARETPLESATQAERPELLAPPRLDVERLDLVAAIGRLPDTLRQVVALRYGRGLALAEIAAQLDIPLGTVKSRLHHGLRRLREDLS